MEKGKIYEKANTGLALAALNTGLVAGAFAWVNELQPLESETEHVLGALTLPVFYCANKLGLKVIKKGKNAMKKGLTSILLAGALAAGSYAAADGAKTVFNDVKDEKIFKTDSNFAKDENIEYWNIHKKHEDAYKNLEGKFEKNAKEYCPKGMDEKYFRALLVAISHVEGQVGTSNNCGPKSNWDCDLVLTGYTAGSEYPMKYWGPQNQLKATAKKLKKEIERTNSQPPYKQLCGDLGGKDLLKCVLNTYHKGDFTQSKKPVIYGDLVLDLADKWMERI